MIVMMAEIPKLTSRDLLFALGTGLILATAIFTPGVVRLAPALRRWHENDKKRLKLYLARLKDRRLVELVIKGDNTYLKITQKGRELIKKFQLENLAISKPSRWDGVWRLVAFDIPNKKRQARDALRKSFKQLGLFPLQKSLFIYPFPCEDEIDFVASFFNVGKYITFAETNKIRDEYKLIRHFDLE